LDLGQLQKRSVVCIGSGWGCIPRRFLPIQGFRLGGEPIEIRADQFSARILQSQRQEVGWRQSLNFWQFENFLRPISGNIHSGVIGQFLSAIKIVELDCKLQYFYVFYIYTFIFLHSPLPSLKFQYSSIGHRWSLVSILCKLSMGGTAGPGLVSVLKPYAPPHPP